MPATLYAAWNVLKASLTARLRAAISSRVWIETPHAFFSSTMLVQWSFELSECKPLRSRETIFRPTHVISGSIARLWRGGIEWATTGDEVFRGRAHQLLSIFATSLFKGNEVANWISIWRSLPESPDPQTELLAVLLIQRVSSPRRI